MLRIIKPVWILVSLLIFSACGGGGGDPGNSDPTVNPTATVSPEASSVITATTPIVVSFSTSMDMGTLSISGSMISDGGVWSTTNVVDDTLTISPQTRWAEGAQTLTFDALGIDGNELGTLTLDYMVDDIIPTVSVSPLSGSAIQNDGGVILSFSESMDVASFTASGSIWDESDQGVWSNTTEINDTLTLSPLIIWSDGNQTLTINANDVAGNVMVAQGYSYVVDATMPVASVSPVSGGTLSQSMPIIIQFSKSMDVSSLGVSGSVGVDISVVWSNGSVENDTLTIAPLPMWNLGDISLLVNASDLLGNAVTELNLSYSVGCATGMMNCNGTCVDTGTDINNCGACATVCGAVPNSTGSICNAGSCEIVACDTGFDDCNSTFSDGCESDITADSGNCGSCGASCNDDVSCSADVCANSACTNISDNTVCPDASSCQVGVCTGTGCDVENLPTGTECGTQSCGGYGSCEYSNACDETGTRTRSCAGPSCNASGSCVNTTYTDTDPCSRNTTNLSCTGGVCNGGSCVECRLDSHCNPGVCTSNNVCVECEADSDCRTGEACIVNRCENVTL